MGFLRLFIVKLTRHHSVADGQSRRRVIGFDMDGVITDEMVGGENIWQQEIEAYFPELRLLEPNFSFTAAYGLSLEKVDEFMKERAPSIFRAVKPQAGSKELLSALQEMGFTVHLITARETCYQEVTSQWLTEHNIQYNSLWFEDEKGILCRRLGVELFVDDYWDNCLDIRDHGIMSLLMSAPHNLGYPEKPGILRVRDWQEIGAQIADYYGLCPESMSQTLGA